MDTNKIVIGDVSNPTVTYENDSIMSINANFSMDYICEELTIDTMEAQVHDEGNVLSTTLLRPSDKEDGEYVYSGIKAINGVLAMGTTSGKSGIENSLYGTEIRWYVNNTLKRLFYITNVSIVSKNIYKIEAQSIVGILDKEYDNGGVCVYGNTIGTIINSVLSEEHDPLFNLDSLYATNGIEYKSIIAKNNSAGHITQYANSDTFQTQNDFWADGFIIDITLPDELPSDGSDFALYGYDSDYVSGSSAELFALYITKDSSRTQNQINYGTNLKFCFNIHGYTPTTEWIGNQSIPYLELGTRHQIGIIPIQNFDYSTYEYKLRSALYVDGKIYKNSIPVNCQPKDVFDVAFGSTYDGNNGYKNRLPGLKLHKIMDYYSDANTSFMNGTMCFANYDNNSLYLCELVYVSVRTQNFSNWDIEKYKTYSYTIDQDYANTMLYGYLTRNTKRENLHQVLFASNGNLYQNADGSFHFGFALNNSSTNIPDSRIFTSGTIELPEHISDVTINENLLYSKYSEAEWSTAFSTDDPVYFKTIYFDKPLNVSLAESTIGVVSYNGSCATVFGTGELRTYGYLTYTNEVVQKTDDKLAQNGILIEDATLYNNKCFNFIKDKIFNYYTKSKKVSNSISVVSENTGSIYTFNSPIKESTRANLVSINLSKTAIEKGECEFVTVDDDIGKFSSKQLLTSTSETTASFLSGKSKARVYLIGGGCGGENGANGENGTTGRLFHYYATTSIRKGAGLGGNGGLGGKGGNGGLVYSFEIENPSGTFSYKAGLGSSNHTNGSSETEGGESTFTYNGTTYSSANGERISVTDPFTMTVYADVGLDGVDGTQGGYTLPEGTLSQGVSVSTSDFYQYTKVKLYKNVNSVEYIPDSDGHGTHASNSYGIAFGGSEGGRCATQSVAQTTGSNGSISVSSSKGLAYGGTGGNGASASTHTDSYGTYGCGGYGGHGGGGGGAGGGVASITGSSGTLVNSSTCGLGGSGGSGGVGNSGHDGCILILYED